MQIDVDDYQAQVAQMRFGKRVGTSIYFHEECVADLPPGIAEIANHAKSTAVDTDLKFNVYKLDTRTPLISLLHYPAFFEEAFPTLERSASWDVSSNSLNTRDYPKVESRPVLHRKELLLPNGHKCIDKFAALTEVAEQVGLFADISRIGRYGYWSSLLDECGIEIIGHSLRRADGRPIEFLELDQEVLRYKTALKRNRLSVPVQSLYKHELIDECSSFLDFGCGRGDDVRQLCDLGVHASGWDPHFSPDVQKRPADIVNLGYVVNVIEDAEERIKVVSDAYGYAKKVMVVSALVGAASYSGKARPYKDGTLTSTGTFQRYFQTPELVELIEQGTNAQPIAVAPGIMYVFKDEELEQRFLARRLTRCRHDRARPIVRSINELSDDAQSQADRYWQACINLGRPASRSEIDGCDDLFKYIPSASQLFDIVCKEKNGSDFEKARERSKEELLVEFALSQFGKRLFFKYFPEPLKRDVQFHFGKYTELQDSAKQLLFSIADTEALLCACVDASDDGVGYLLDDHSLQLHMSLVDQLAPILRVYIGCAGVLYGEWSQVDLVKVHIQTGKVSFMGYDDFDGRPVPDLLERIKVRMWEREVDFFDYIGEYVPTPLFMKSLFIDESFDYFDEQAAFDQSLMRAQLFDFMRDNVSKAQFYGALEQAGYRIAGYELAKVA
jgi:DNA phosphorothioation-associated putative methyltransferase